MPESYYGVPVVTALRRRRAHHGLQVHVWTVDDPERMRYLADLNVDAIMTDVPSLTLKTLG